MTRILVLNLISMIILKSLEKMSIALPIMDLYGVSFIFIIQHISFINEGEKRNLKL